MNMLCGYGAFDIQWGNHDALWMGACAGNACCMANVLRLSLRYGNMATLEDGYGIKSGSAGYLCHGDVWR